MAAQRKVTVDLEVEVKLPVITTRDKLVDAFRAWEADRRLHPDDYRNVYEVTEVDVDRIAEESADFLLELLAEASQ